MKKKTLKAIKKSIEKWEKIVSEKGRDEGDDNCALCGLFLKDECIDCPVYAKTKRKGCRGTPYEDWIDHQGNHFYYANEHYYVVKCPECKELAQKELEFLKSLLPKNFHTVFKLGNLRKSRAWKKIRLGWRKMRKYKASN